MSAHARNIEQYYWRDPRVPHVEIRNTCNSTLGYKAHSHAELSVGIIESGQTQLTHQSPMGDEAVTLFPNDLILIPPHLVHACNPIMGTARSYHMLYVDMNWCLETLTRVYDQPVKSLPSRSVVIRNQALAEHYFAITHHLDSERANLSKLDNFLIQLLASYCDINAEPMENDDLAFRVKQIFLQNLAEPPSLDNMAIEFSTTAETIIRKFKKTYGITPKAFLQNARIEKAKALLRGGTPIVDTALEVGYADQSQFHKAFVTFCAATPRQYQDSKAYANSQHVNF